MMEADTDKTKNKLAAEKGWSDDHPEAKIKRSEPLQNTNPKPPKVEKAKVDVIGDVNQYPDNSIYPFNDMEPGAGFFVANEPNLTTEQTLDRVAAQVTNTNYLYSEAELDQNGDEVWEEIIIRGFKRKSNGAFELDSMNKPVPTSDHVIVPRRIYARKYSVRRIAVDDLIAGKKSEADGVLVTRVI